MSALSILSSFKFQREWKDLLRCPFFVVTQSSDTVNIVQGLENWTEVKFLPACNSAIYLNIPRMRKSGVTLKYIYKTIRL